MTRTLRFPSWWQAGLVLLALAPAKTPDVNCTRARAEVEAIARDLVAGIAAGDWTPWERQAADGLLYTTEFGRTLTKQQLETVFRPVDRPSRRMLTMAVIGFHSKDEAAVLALELVERGPDGVERYRVTQTYWRIGGRWRLVASHACRVADDSAAPAPEGNTR